MLDSLFKYSSPLQFLLFKPTANLKASMRLKGQRIANVDMRHSCFLYSSHTCHFPLPKKKPHTKNEDYNYQSAEYIVDLSLAKSSIIMSVLTRVLDCEVSARSTIFSKLDLPERHLDYCGAERDNQADSPADNIINTELNLCLNLMHC